MSNPVSTSLPRRHFLGAASAVSLTAFLAGCGAQNAVSEATTASSGDQTNRPAGWTDESHGNKVDPNYGMVFPSDKVNQIAIVVTEARWNEMLADMTKLMGTRGQQGNRGGMGQQPGGQPGQQPGQMPGGQPGQMPGGQGIRGGGMPGGGMDMTPTNPMWVPANIEFNGKTWTNVGIRFKGNSSLRSSWGSGTDKMPFKFDFDQFEADYPDIKNQRFYGFKQLSVNPNFSDASNIRETVAYDLLADAGLVAAETGFYEVVLDHGQGRQSLGLYTFVENIDDTVVKRTFKQADGNIYEGDGAAASLASGTLDRIPDSFQVESDKAKADWSDIKALYNALHAADRTTNPANWRKNLEATFDVDVFLKWLGLSATMQHWDTYGAMSHNFYLYNDPATKKLTWISWDHNQILGSGGGGMVGVQNGQPVQGVPGQQGGQQVIPGGPGGNQGGPGGRGNVSIDQKSVGAQWPLIRFLMDDPTYYATYVAYLKETMNVFAPDKLEAKYQAYAAVLAPTVAKTGDVTAFQNAITSLTTATRTRYQLAQDFLKTA